MRKSHFLLAGLVALACAAIGAATLADDRPGAGTEDRQPPQPPAKKFDLGNLDLTKPPVDPATVKAPAVAEKPKAKPIVKYRTADIVPAGAALVLEVPRAARARRNAAGGPLGRLLDDERLGPAWDKHVVRRLENLPPVTAGAPGGKGILDILRKLEPLFEGDAVAAAYVPGPAAGAARSGWSILLAGEVEDARRQNFLELGCEEIKTLAGLARNVSSERLTSGDFDYRRVRSASGSLAMAYGAVGNQLVVEFDIRPGEGPALYERVLKAATSGGEGSLAREAAHVDGRAVLAKDAKDADLYLRADIGALAGSQVNLAPMGVKYVAASLRFESSAVHERIFMAIDPASLMAKTLPKRQPAAGLALLAPLDTCFFQLRRQEPGAGQATLDMLKAMMNKDQLAAMEKARDAFEKKAEIPLSELVEGLAGDWASALTLTPGAPGGGAEMLHVFRPDDMEKAKKALAAMERVAGTPFKAELMINSQVRYVEEPEGAGSPEHPAAARRETLPERLQEVLPGFARRSGGEAVPPGLLPGFKAYAVTGEYIVIGTSLRTVRTALRQNDPAQHAAGIPDRPEYKEARAQFGSAASEIEGGFVDLRRIGELLYAAAGASGKAGDLPPADKALEEVISLAWSGRTVPGGVSGDVVSQVGLLPLALGLSAQISLDAMEAAAAREAAAHAAKLKTIWRGMEFFATEFGRYPLNLSELSPNYVRDKEAFLTPEQESAEPKVVIAKPEEVDAKSGYRYVSGRTPGAVGSSIVVYSAKPDARGEHWCLTVNGGIRQMRTEALEKALGSAAKPLAGIK